MNVTVDAKELVKVLRLHNKIQPKGKRRNGNSIFGMTLLEANTETQTLRCTATDLHTVIDVTLPASVPSIVDNNACCVDTALLLGMVKSASGTVRLQRSDGALSVDKQSINEVRSALDFPPLPFVSVPLETLTLRPEHIAALADDMVPFLAKDDSRPVLQCVNIQASAKSSRFASANGWQMTIVDYSEPAQPFTANIYGSVFPIIDAAMGKTAGNVTLVRDAQNAMFTWKEADRSYQILTRVSEQSYPQYEQLIPDSKAATTRITVQPVALLSLVQAALPIAAESANIVRFVCDSVGVTVLAKSSAGEYEEVLPCAVRFLSKGACAKIAADCFMLRDILHVLRNNETVTIELQGPSLAWKFTTDDGLIHVLMPMHVEW